MIAMICNELLYWVMQQLIKAWPLPWQRVPQESLPVQTYALQSGNPKRAQPGALLQAVQTNSTPHCPQPRLLTWKAYTPDCFKMEKVIEEVGCKSYKKFNLTLKLSTFPSANIILKLKSLNYEIVSH